MRARKADELTPVIRRESAGDEAAIAEAIAQAFEASRYGDQGEAKIVERLRRDGALTLSIVAESDGRIEGHLAISPVRIAPDPGGGWFGLGPVAVSPSHQRQGIGGALISAALSELEARGAGGCVVVGEPAYYRRFGFEPAEGLTVEGVPPQYVLLRSFGASRPVGTAYYHAAFAARP